MEQSYFRKQADKCRHLARDSTDPVLKVSLRRLADDYQMKADELENDEISAKRGDPVRVRFRQRSRDTFRLSSLIPRQLAASQMLVLSRRVEHPLNVAVQGSHHA
jgi:hypothetical protein